MLRLFTQIGGSWLAKGWIRLPLRRGERAGRLLLLGLIGLVDAGSRLIVIADWLRSGNAQHGHAAAAHGLHAEGVAVLGDHVTGTRELVGHVGDVAGDGLVLLVVFHRPAKVDGIIEREATVDQPLTIGELGEVLVVGVELVLDLAHNLLDDVLDGDDACRATILVHHDDHLVVA